MSYNRSPPHLPLSLLIRKNLAQLEFQAPVWPGHVTEQVGLIILVFGREAESADAAGAVQPTRQV
jgi:hypothetical protein